jgi:hypothetical protein
MFRCHSARRRVTILASFSGCATIAGVSPDGPGPIRPHWRISTPSLAGSTSNAQVALLDLDDLADRRPIPERLMLVATAETRTDGDGVGIVDPLDGLQLR